MSTSSQRYNAAEKLKDAGQLAEAAEMIEQLLADDPDHVLSHMMLGKIYVDLGRYDDAIKHNQRAVELEPNEPLNHSALSVQLPARLGRHARPPLHPNGRRIPSPQPPPPRRLSTIFFVL